MKPQRWLVFGAALLLSVVTARLGFWQLDRAAQKTALQQSLNDQRQRPTLALAELATTSEQASQQVHRSVALQGRWLQEHTVYLENRQMNGRVGFFAVTPLKLTDGTVVLVQRGWFARDLLDRLRIVAQPAPEGLQWVQGRIALSPSRLYEFDGAGVGAIRQNLVLADFGRETGLPLRPLTVVQEDAAGSVAGSAAGSAAGGAADGLLRQWAPPSLGVDKNHGYAFQWFALSALSAGLWLWLQVLQPRRKRAAQKAAQGTSTTRLHDDA